RRQRAAIGGDEGELGLPARVRFAVRLHRDREGRARAGAARRAVPSLWLSERHAEPAARRRRARRRCAGAADLRRTLEERHPPRHGGAPDPVGAAALVGHAAVFSARVAAAVAVRARRWDAIVAHWLVPSAIAALPTRAPLLAIAHGGDVHTLKRARLLAPVLHALKRRGAQLVFVSDELRAIA